ncbi:MAG: OadG family protein, partial [Eubacteriales bacterium]|nr:OadG family protein [Eubacteriales bacterium]
MKKTNKLFRSCIAAVLFAILTVFSSFAATTDLGDQMESELIAECQSFAESVFSLSEADIAQYIEVYEASGITNVSDALKSYQTIAATKGNYVSTESATISQNEDGSYSITVIANFEKGKVSFLGVLPYDLSDFTTMKFDEIKTKAQLLGEGFINLVVGMGTVFAVLIFLAWVISLFKYINKVETKLKERKANKNKKAEAPKAAAPAPVVTVTSAPANASADEIQAVIAAAIAAYESDNG